MTLTDLIAALERAEGPSRELDYEIRKCLGYVDMPLDVAFGRNDGNWARRVGDQIVSIGSHQDSGSTTRDLYLPRYTASLDAALSLVLDGATVELAWGGGSPHCYADINQGFSGYVHGIGKTPALALCIAALKARASQ